MEVNIRSFGAVGDGIADDEPAFSKAFETMFAGTLYIPNGKGWRFARQPARIKHGIVLRGEPYTRTKLIRDYVPATDDEPFIRAGNSTQFESITFQSAPGIYGKGCALSIVSDDGAVADWVKLRDCMIRGDGTNSSSWKRGLHASGINRTGSTLGVRDLEIQGGYFSDCDEYALYFENMINLMAVGITAYRNAGADCKIAITGATGHESERLTIIGNIAGKLSIDYAKKVFVGGVVDEAIDVAETCSYSKIGVAGNPAVTNASTTSKVETSTGQW